MIRSDFKDLVSYNYYKDIFKPIYKQIESVIPSTIGEAIKKLPISLDDITSDTAAAGLEKMIAAFYAKYGGERVFREFILSKLDSIAGNIIQKSKRDLDREIGKEVERVSIFERNSTLERKKDQWLEENVALIKTIPEASFKKIESVVWDSIRKGTHRGDPRADQPGKNTLIGKLMQEFKITQKRAALIARDQTGKFYSSLQSEQYKAVGVEYYTWRTSNDVRVRDRHEEVEGQIFRLGEPPPVGNKGERLEPGQDYQCRCGRIAHMGALRDEVEMIQVKDTLKGISYTRYEPRKIKVA